MGVRQRERVRPDRLLLHGASLPHSLPSTRTESSRARPTCAGADPGRRRAQINLLNDATYEFLDSNLANLWQAQPGADITGAIANLNLDSATLETNMACIRTLFYQGDKDFRLEARCKVQPNLLLAFTVVLMATILAKFVAALQFGSKRMPEPRDKFVICQ